jgi:hypothetical protein
MTGRDEIFNVGLFSGMITSIEFTYKDKKDTMITTNITISGQLLREIKGLTGENGEIEGLTGENGETEGLTGENGFFTLYPSMGSLSPYKMFKSKLYDILSRNTGIFTRSINVKITTDFSKTPDYSSVQTDALKAANSETIQMYNVAKQNRDEAKLKVENAKNAVDKFGTAYTQDGRATKENLESILKQATDELKQAQTATTNVYQVAFNAAKAAESAGVQPVTYPVVN